MWISEAAEAAGVNVETVRYYERRGLLPQPARPEHGYRHYSDESVRLLRFIKHAQDLGFTLDDVQELARLNRTAERDRERARTVAERKLAEIEHKIARLSGMRLALRRLVSSCRTGRTPECPILEAIEKVEPPADVGAPRAPTSVAAKRRGRTERERVSAREQHA